MTTSKCKVLIVDDNSDLLPLFSFIDSDEIEFITAAGGLDALALIEHTPNLCAVLLDLAMPTLDGIAVVEEIRRNEKTHADGTRPKLRLAFFTASTVDRVIHRVQLENNVERVFLKPVDPLTLLEEIKRWLNV